MKTVHNCCKSIVNNNWANVQVLCIYSLISTKLRVRLFTLLKLEKMLHFYSFSCKNQFHEKENSYVIVTVNI